MGLDIRVLDANNDEIDLKQTFDDDDDMGFVPPVNDGAEFNEQTVADDLEGFGLEDENGEAIVEESEVYSDESYGDEIDAE